MYIFLSSNWFFLFVVY